MNWQQLLEETLGVVSIYTFFRVVIRRVEAGQGSEAEQQLIADIKAVAIEYKNKALLEEKLVEAADIAERQRKFRQKWGVVVPRITIGTPKQL